ncbi:hypothetical protein FDE77_15025 [Clostridium botulinum]|nr:hypothetical protein [Clostridium botulinum]
MAEILLLYSILLYVGLMSDAEYKEYLDALFLKNPDNDLLLELEWKTSDIEGTIKIIFYYCLENNVDYGVFGYFLIIWRVLPSEIEDKEPFFTLCYADDPLSWGDEDQTREIYQKMFQYYKK